MSRDWYNRSSSPCYDLIDVVVKLESDTSVYSEVTSVPDVEVCTLCTLQNTLETAKDIPTEGPERSQPASVEEFKS